jgi:hypothetical protein
MTEMNLIAAQMLMGGDLLVSQIQYGLSTYSLSVPLLLIVAMPPTLSSITNSLLNLMYDI